MDSALLEMPKRVGRPFEVGAIGALDATASGETRAIKRNDENLIRQLTETLDKQLLGVLSCRTAEEFGSARHEAWEKYFRARRAFSDTIDLLVPKNAVETMRVATMEKIAEDLDRFRNVLFGSEISEQFEFTLWIVNRIQCVAQEIARSGQPRDRDTDSRLNEDFCLYTAWGQFHYDCILASMKFERPIPAEIQPSIRDGLRAWVNASAIAEEALSLRLRSGPQEGSEFFDHPWDEEDQELLESSMRDLNVDCSSDL